MQFKESKEQASLIQWARLSINKYPELVYLHCSLNSVQLSSIQDKIAKSQGMIKGIPDLFLPVRRGTYSGLYIEMKIKGNELTLEQEKFLSYVESQGYCVDVCYNWIEAKNTLINYLEIIN